MLLSSSSSFSRRIPAALLSQATPISSAATTTSGRTRTTSVSPFQQASASTSSSPGSSSKDYNAQRRREWAVVVTAAGGLAVSGSWYWFHVRPRRQADALQQHELLLQQQKQQQQQQEQQQKLQQLQVQQAAASNMAPRGSRPFSTSAAPSFLIPSRTRSASGERQQKVITLLTESQVNQKLRANEHSVIVDRPAGVSLITRYDSNVVPSNDPCEDRRVEIIVESDHVIPEVVSSVASRTKGDLFFGAIMDGHAGFHTSALLTQKLISAVALELDKVFSAKGEYADLLANPRKRSSGGLLSNGKESVTSKMWNSVFGATPGPSGQHTATFVQPPSVTSTSTPEGKEAKGAEVSVSSGLESDPEIIKHAIRKAFLTLDSEIVNTPVELLKEYELSLAAAAASQKSGENASPKPIRPGTASAQSAGPNTPNNAVVSNSGALSQFASSLFPSSSSSSAAAFTATQRTVYEAMLPALSGSCALLAYIDSARGDLYVACTGDSRALAGYYDSVHNKWIIEPLSTDQTGRNPSEVKRMRAEHPLSEASTVIMRGRVLGGLEPTRAFGDARYKWDKGVQERLYETFLPGGRAAARGPPKLLETPPYVTARPEVEFRKIAPGLVGGGSHPERELKFVVMATDGLWDMLENEEVGALVAGHLGNVRGTVLASSLHEACFNPSSSTGTSSAEQQQQQQQQQLQEASSSSKGERAHPLSQAPANLRAYTFEDDNLSTHLVRNALGGANRDRVAGLLAIPSPESRWYRDDITVNVILFNTAAQQQHQEQQQQKEAEQDKTGSKSEDTTPRAKL
ncbi:hypothetical protein A4X13_0g1182 [Tilletia indica]|uniref:Uncharacterized protein n=1 Tax=Tilletia indica TaxID=43049 RepID=A0A177TRB4_9BASI|nr:hypothetical protein A4X13_0g1182 [Tilletia indica]